MRRDEFELLNEKIKSYDIHPKRLLFLLKKWNRKGWYRNGRFLDAGRQIKHFIKETHNNSDYLNSLDRHVCILYTINWMPPICGILMDYGDNGFHFFTRKVFHWPSNNVWPIGNTWSPNGGYFLGHYAGDTECVAWVQQHPNPAKLWREFNYLAYMKNPKYNKDYWHQHKRYDWTTNNYVGCLPTCQCKTITYEP